MVAEESVMDVFIGGVKVVQHHIGVAGMGSSEDDDLEMFGEVFDDLLGVGSDVDRSQHGMASRKSDRDFYFMFF